MERRSTKTNLPSLFDENDSSTKMGPIDKHNYNINSYINIIWTTIKVIIILFVIFPFIDKIRHKDYFTKAVNMINEFDIGCKPCHCPELVFNCTKREEDKRDGF